MPRPTPMHGHRQRRTRRGVKLADRAARVLVTLGGLATILAVLGVFVFLIRIVLPLFLPAEIDDVVAVKDDWAGKDPLHIGIGERQNLGWALLASGVLEVFRLDTGETRDRQEMFAEGRLTAVSLPIRGPQITFGLRDGSVVTGEVELVSEILPPEGVPQDLRRELEAAPRASYRKGIVERLPSGAFRYERIEHTSAEKFQGAEGPIRRLSHAVTARGSMIVVLAEPPPEGDETEAGGAEVGAPRIGGAERSARSAGLRLRALVGEEESDFLTGRERWVFDQAFGLPFEPVADGLPDFLEISGSGTDVFVGWRTGELLRIHVPPSAEAFIAEKGRLTPPGIELTAMSFLIGRRTLVWGDSTGAVRGGFLVRRADSRAAAGPRSLAPKGQGGSLVRLERDPRAPDSLTSTRELAPGNGDPILALAPGARRRLIFSGSQGGEIRLFHVTGENELASLVLEPGSAIRQLTVAPREDGLIALVGARLYHGAFDAGHPEASLRSLFRPIWYEGYGEPRHLWQSSGGTDDFEPKLGLYPLIFGTVKAAFYSLLFGAPLAFLAAIFTSEFLGPRARAVIKPTVELMASLPSVVLGFLAALVFAPFLDDVLPTALTLFLTLPVAFLAGAYLWQFLPADSALASARWRFVAIAAMTPLGLGAAVLLSPGVERALFAGDVLAWLSWDGAAGEERFAAPTGGWMLLLLPIVGLFVVRFGDRFLSPWMRARSVVWDRRRFALADAVRFLAVLLSTLALTFALAFALGRLGFDPRGTYLDTYVQRNALVVGIFMGFAVIPIMYSIAEDALRSVPEHLRSASLGAGATPWQTAVRIVIPAAMSGLFSALMIGLGRAVGETMIVLMAAGNTPILEWNIFNGLRTLSANIAVEMPEAVKDSTHYRTLFLAALVLFAMTFVINTIAEGVRQHYRRKAHRL